MRLLVATYVESCVLVPRCGYNMELNDKEDDDDDDDDNNNNNNICYGRPNHHNTVPHVSAVYHDLYSGNMTC